MSQALIIQQDILDIQKEIEEIQAIIEQAQRYQSKAFHLLPTRDMACSETTTETNKEYR